IRDVGPSNLKDKSVALSDSSGTLIAGTETPIGDTGRFFIRYKLPAAAPSPAGQPKSEQPSADVFISVIDSRRRTIYQDQRALRPRNGTVSYLELHLQPVARPRDVAESTPDSGSTRTPSRQTPQARDAGTS